MFCIFCVVPPYPKKDLRFVCISDFQMKLFILVFSNTAVDRLLYMILGGYSTLFD